MTAALVSPGAFVASWLPEPWMIWRLGPWMVAYTGIAAWWVGRLRVRRMLATGYTRKVFHFLIFGAATLLQVLWGRGAVVLFGSIVSLFVLAAVWRGNGLPFYEGLARPRDEPRRSLFILVPLATTALGGVATNLLFPDYAHVGYLVAGTGDALGEPVGTRWGRHPYRVPSLAGVPATRTLEGSAAVLVGSWSAAVVALLLQGCAACSDGQVATLALACAVGVTAVEAVSHHGTDNFTVQVAAAAAVALFV